MSRTRILVAGLAVVLLLGFLSGAIWNASFRGGRPLPVAEPTPGGAGGSPIGEEEFIRFLMRALHLLLLASVAITVVVFVLVPEYRKQIIRFLLSSAVLVLIVYLIVSSLANSRLEPPEREAPLTGQSGPGEAIPQEVEGPPSAPDWLVYLVGVAAGGLLAWWGVRLLTGRVTLSRRRRLGEELARAAGEAAAELRAGAPVADVVARCWLRMVEILSRRAGVRDAPHLTPEELAQELSRRGFSHQAILLLTRLFEEVRYGHKDSQSRREEALDALAAIERAYG